MHKLFISSPSPYDILFFKNIGKSKGFHWPSGRRDSGGQRPTGSWTQHSKSGTHPSVSLPYTFKTIKNREEGELSDRQ